MPDVLTTLQLAHPVMQPLNLLLLGKELSTERIVHCSLLFQLTGLFLQLVLKLRSYTDLHGVHAPSVQKCGLVCWRAKSRLCQTSCTVCARSITCVATGAWAADGLPIMTEELGAEGKESALGIDVRQGVLK